jgi:hypothetical protein
VDAGTIVPLLLGTISSLTVAIGVLWRQSVAESRRKDELIDRLLKQLGRTTDATERVVSVAERRRERGSQ